DLIRFNESPATTTKKDQSQPAPVNPLAKLAAEEAAYKRLQSERNAETKKKLLLTFEKNFPKSKHLPDLYIDWSRNLVSQSDFTSAVEYAKKAVNAVAIIRNDAPGLDKDDLQWQSWIAGLETGTRSNLTWAQQMLTWQQQQIRERVTPRR